MDILSLYKYISSVMFKVERLSKELKKSMISKNIWQSYCPLTLEQLRLIKIEHYDFEGQRKIGTIVIHHKMADSAIDIFKKLLDLEFPIAKMTLIDNYNGDDELSMEDNNSSCFNCRKIANSSELSVHSYGLAIDINPLQNPYIVIDHNNYSIDVYPREGVNFLNRNNQRPGMVESVVDVFKKHGFDIWGGHWNNPIDYHHFQVSRELAKKMSSLL
ncbi:MAG: M15 family metallopeptidase [Janthinobacterium lividum]